MKYKYLKEWAKEKGYNITRNGAIISWFKDSDSSVCGQSDLNGEVATAIYNHMTDYVWVDYQNECRYNKVIDQHTFRTYD